MLDFFTDLYYYKKAYLIGEDCLGHAVNKITKPYEDRIETIDSVKELIDLFTKAKDAILKHIPENVISEGEWTGIDYVDYVDYDKYTRRNYGNVFFNEIPNDNLTDTALKRYFEISNLKGWIESENGYPNAYMVTLYNFNNYEVMFENEKYLEDFIQNNNLDTATVYSKRIDCWIEAYDI